MTNHYHALFTLHPLFKGVPVNDIEKFVSKSKILEFTASTVARQYKSDNIYLLLKGKIKVIEYCHDETCFIWDIVSSPDVFGNLDFEPRGSEDFIEILENRALVACFHYKDLAALMSENAVVASNMLVLLTKKLKTVKQRHKSTVSYPVEQRFENFIQQWAKDQGTKTNNTVVLRNNLTHTDISRIIDCSRQCVNKLFNTYKKNGHLSYDRQYIKISIDSPLSQIL